MIDSGTLTRITVDDMLVEWAVAESHEWVAAPPELLRIGRFWSILRPELAASLASAEEGEIATVALGGGVATFLSLPPPPGISASHN